MNLIVRMEGLPYGHGGSGTVRRLRVVFKGDGVETTCRIEVAGLVSGWNTMARGAAYLGKGDTYDFNAGCRISFERAWRSLDWQALDPEFVKQLRRAVQIELALAKLDAKGQALDKALSRTAKEYLSLLRLRANNYEPVPVQPKGDLVAALAEVIRRLNEADKMRDVSQHHGDPSKVNGKNEPLTKPDAYKNVRTSETGKSDFPVREYPILGDKGKPGPLPCFHLIVGVTDDILPPECAECAGASECCAKHGGVS